jgi:hypothetical protein
MQTKNRTLALALTTLNGTIYTVPDNHEAEIQSVVISNAAQGEILISMDSANTANMSPGRYVYDLTITDPNSIVTRVVEGIVIVSPGTTRNGN